MLDATYVRGLFQGSSPGYSFGLISPEAISWHWQGWPPTGSFDRWSRNISVFASGYGSHNSHLRESEKVEGIYYRGSLTAAKELEI